ncbi:hypothetical protein UY286_26295 [Paenibacillus polymyxa]|nr:hypothetical protein [Paenibacillus polymyxa]MDY8120922.1 hypothetical protein [Paenibacillus polymyxa]
MAIKALVVLSSGQLRMLLSQLEKMKSTLDKILPEVIHQYNNHYYVN